VSAGLFFFCILGIVNVVAKEFFDMGIHDPIILPQRRIIEPIITEAEAEGKQIFHGKDEQGPFVAYRLDNQASSMFEGWYIFISPEDLHWVKKYTWCASFRNRSYIGIRHKEYKGNDQKHFFLNQEIWKHMGQDPVPRIYLQGHPLDFRRKNLSMFRSPYNQTPNNQIRGVGWSTARQKWQVQILVNGTNQYVGLANTKEDGARMFNRFLDKLKKAFPEDLRLQLRPFNQVSPMF